MTRTRRTIVATTAAAVLTQLGCTAADPADLADPAGTAAGPNATTTGQAADRSPIILLQGPTGQKNPDGPSTRTKRLVANADYVRSLTDAVDGVVIDLPAGGHAMRGSALDCDEQSETFVEPLVESGAVAGFDSNFLRMQLRRIDIFDDRAADIARANWACMGRLAQDVGAVGIFLDTESYDGPDPKWKNSIYNWLPDSGHTLDEYTATIRRRFAEWVSAYMTEQPDGTLLLSRGSVDGATAPASIDLYSSPEEFEGTVASMVGAVEGATTPSQVVDSMQLYWLRTQDEYQDACDWTRTELPKTEPGKAIPPELLDEWQAMPCGHGSYDKPWPANDPRYAMSPTTFRDQVVAQGRVESVRYRWLFLERGELMDPGYATNLTDWSTAIREAHASS
ncbi:MAG: hypothetical protein ACRCY8_17130 [Dermatophilaceae bacterium]